MEVSTDSIDMTSQLSAATGPDLNKERAFSVSAAMGNIREVAAMAYGSGLFEGASGGKGHIGVLNGKVIKFNTHSSERDAVEKMHSQGEDYEQMLAASDKLRVSLVESLKTVLVATKDGNFKDQEASQSRITAKAAEYLGLKTSVNNEKVFFASENGQFAMQENRGLLTRSAAAKVVTLIRDYLRNHYPDPQALFEAHKSDDRFNDAHFSVWRNVEAMKNRLSSEGKNTGFEYVQKMETALEAVNTMKSANGFLASIRTIGNNKMKTELDKGHIHLDYHQGFQNPPTVVRGSKTFKTNYAEQANGICRYFKTKAMIDAMDKMFAELIKKCGVDNKEIENALGKTPFKKAFNSVVADSARKALKRGLEVSIKNRNLQRNDAEQKMETFLEDDNLIVDFLENSRPIPALEFSLNRNRALVSLVRDKLLAQIAPQDNEILKDDAGAEIGISTNVLFAKDFLRQCADMLSIKADKDLRMVIDPQGNTELLCFDPTETLVFTDKFYT